MMVFDFIRMEYVVKVEVAIIIISNFYYPLLGSFVSLT